MALKENADGVMFGLLFAHSPHTPHTSMCRESARLTFANVVGRGILPTARPAVRPSVCPPAVCQHVISRRFLGNRSVYFSYIAAITCTCAGKTKVCVWEFCLFVCCCCVCFYFEGKTWFVILWCVAVSRSSNFSFHTISLKLLGKTAIEKC